MFTAYLYEFFLIELNFAIVIDGVPPWFSRPRIPPRWQAVIRNKLPNLSGTTWDGNQACGLSLKEGVSLL